MKRHLIALMVIVALTLLLLGGCAQEAELRNRISSLENRIEQLEKRELTVGDIHKALEGERLRVQFNSWSIFQGMPITAWITTE